jgi:UDP:flavonoid glycosyltransferase YjiC (YdhE family)
MRVLCTCVPGYGHFHPMVPLARALQAAGHDLAFATAERFCTRVTAAGFDAFPAGLNPGPMVQRAVESFAGAGGDEWRFGAHMFAGVAAPAKLPALNTIVDDWRPDLLIYDVTDFAGPPAAAGAGIPGVAHSLGPMFPVEFHRLAAELLPHEPSALYLDICPPSLQSDGVDDIATATQQQRPVPFDAVAGESLPAWVARLAPQATVYITLGTLDNEAPGVIEAAVEGLRDEPLNVVVTVGPNRDPDELGPQPANVHVERYVPQSLLLPHCDAVVAHGGSGTTLAALAHGLPLLLLPQGANQFWNAERCAGLGVCVRLLPGQVDAGSVRHAVQALLGRPAYKERAADLAGEIAAMPDPHDVVSRLEALRWV